MNNKFSSKIARIISINAALVYEFFHKGIAEEQAENYKILNNKKYITISINDLKEIYPYLTIVQIRLATRKLVSNGLLEKETSKGILKNTSMFTITKKGEKIYMEREERPLHAQQFLKI